MDFRDLIEGILSFLKYNDTKIKVIIKLTIDNIPGLEIIVSNVSFRLSSKKSFNAFLLIFLFFLLRLFNTFLFLDLFLCLFFGLFFIKFLAFVIIVLYFL